ncbi:transcription termination factor MTERF6, chloroplastic/mitochondrial-like [Malus domestica]|uniref:transcription termination factor MTERF6, chloroplastic/mitochondrial-like n=1 Tax=Malus domestica TaxID=3750 RepID=UPI0010AB40BC|nr:transcription termination factor MTERF15, mitochondrial-like [Malus domestica]XP_008347988.2 transcription termination factor MTERF15, mitochondrial-like [Malus domestica]XP_028951588.1 transcription termination factor MTERF15, mitochondrial-like [Malus domestica]XP_028951593.1 transcription termination factor MTERF15, mitochondrial-like [Malus domestica]
MVLLSKLKVVTLRLCHSPSSCIVASTFKRFVVGDVKPSHFPLQNMLLCRRFTSESSETHHDFTVNYLINSCGLSPEGAISASKWVELRSPKSADSVLSLLSNHGFSESQISYIVRNHSQVLNSNPEKTLLPKLEFFASLGFSEGYLAKTLAYEPNLLSTSLEKRIAPTYDFLRSLLSQKNVVSVLRRGSWIFAEGHSKKVAPNIEVLRDSGIPQSCISHLLVYHPKVFMRKPKELGELVDEVKQMGFNLQKSKSVLAIYALCGSNRSVWNRSRKIYKRWGWSEDDVLSAFRSQPYCMIVSEKKLIRALEFLVNEMGWSSKIIVKSPQVICLSLEKRVIPRCSVVKVLLLKGLIKGIENVSLSSLLVPAEKYFLERFVARNINEVPQLLSVYQGRVEVQDV